mmetsp:Transcript_41582/g.67928  ORF Transcript_41582/g.67928 Transcript_41582/m.67928 type:complete len:669 (+) Transcript_41582:43-2049(+)
MFKLENETPAAPVDAPVEPAPAAPTTNAAEGASAEAKADKVENTQEVTAKTTTEIATQTRAATTEEAPRSMADWLRGDTNLGDPLDVLGSGRSRRGVSSVGLTLKERAAFIESMIASGNSRDRSKSDKGTYLLNSQKKDDDEEEDGRSRASSNVSYSYFNETNVRDVAKADGTGQKLNSNAAPFTSSAMREKASAAGDNHLSVARGGTAIINRQKRAVSDAAFAPTKVTSRPPPNLQSAVSREKRSVSDAAYLKWARKQASVPEDEDEEDEDYEDYEQGGHSTKARVCKAIAITDPNTNEPINLSQNRGPGHSKQHHADDEDEEEPGMTWEEFRYKDDYHHHHHHHHHAHHHHHHHHHAYGHMPMGYPMYGGMPPNYTVPFAGQPMYPPGVYPGSQQLVYIHRTPERYRWEQSLQKFVKTMDASIAYYPMPPPGMPGPPMGMSMQPPMPSPPGMQQHSNSGGPGSQNTGTSHGKHHHHSSHHHHHHHGHHHHQHGHHHHSHHGPPGHHHHHHHHHSHQRGGNNHRQRNTSQEETKQDIGNQGNRHDNKKKDSRDPYSFSAFLTAKDVTIPGDDAASRGMMMDFLNEYLAQVTNSHPKRHVRNAQRQLKMLQRRAQQDTEAAAGGGPAPEITEDPAVMHASAGTFQGSPYMGPGAGTPAFNPPVMSAPA